MSAKRCRWRDERAAVAAGADEAIRTSLALEAERATSGANVDNANAENFMTGKSGRLAVAALQLPEVG